MSEITKKLEELEEDIVEYAKKAGNSREDITLVVVTKTHGMDMINEALDYGIKNIGENKVKEIENKYEFIPNDVNIHMIGNLQTNKVKKLVGKVSLIQSLDRLSLLKEMEKVGESDDYVFNCLIQLDISKEQSKTGISVEDLDKFIEEIEKCKHVKVQGFMTMAPFREDPEEIRWVFKEAKELFEKYSKIMYNNIKLKYLSMGMTNDYKVALEEGANMIRVGSKIFGKREYN